MWHVWGEGIRGSMGRPERKGPHGRPRREWEGNIAMDLKEMGCEVVGLDLALGRNNRRVLVNAVVNLIVITNTCTTSTSQVKIY